MTITTETCFWGVVFFYAVLLIISLFSGGKGKSTRRRLSGNRGYRSGSVPMSSHSLSGSHTESPSFSRESYSSSDTGNSYHWEHQPPVNAWEHQHQWHVPHHHEFSPPSYTFPESAGQTPGSSFGAPSSLPSSFDSSSSSSSSSFDSSSSFSSSSNSDW